MFEKLKQNHISICLRITLVHCNKTHSKNHTLKLELKTVNRYETINKYVTVYMYIPVLVKL